MNDLTLEELISELGLEGSPELERAYNEQQLQLPLAALRKTSGLTQAQMAKRLGKSQAAVSKFEGRGDFLCSTLFNYARAIGADVRANIRIKGQVFDLIGKQTDGDTYFSLVKRMSTCEDISDIKATDIREFAESSARRKKIAAPQIFEWGHSTASKPAPAFNNILIKIASETHEKFSNTA